MPNLQRLEALLAEQLRRDRAKPSRRRPGPDGTIIVTPGGRSCGLALAIEHITGEDTDTIINRLVNEEESVTTEPAQQFGLGTPASAFGPRGVIARPEVTASGNIVLGCGNELETGGWTKSVHVTLQPDEAIALYEALGVALADAWAARAKNA